MQDAFTHLLEYLRSTSVAYDIIEHEPVFTMDDVARVLTIPVSARVKTLVLRTGSDENHEAILCGISASGRLSLPAVSSYMGITRSRLKMASPTEAENLLGVPRGAIGLVIPDRSPRVLLSRRFQGEPELFFGAGRNDRTLRLPIDSLARLCTFEFANIEQE